MKKFIKLLIILFTLFLATAANTSEAQALSIIDYNRNLLYNGSASKGLENWYAYTDDGNGNDWRADDHEGAYSGGMSFWPGNVARGELHQDILVGDEMQRINAGHLTAEISGWQKNYGGNSDGDNGSMGFSCYTEDWEFIGYYGTPLQDFNDTWTKVNYSMVIPQNTYYLTAVLRGVRKTGTNCDAYFDDISVVIKDTKAPSVQYVTSSTPNGRYKAGDKISIQVKFDEPVLAYASPYPFRIKLNTNQYADYSGGNNTDTFTFTYTVGAGANTIDLDYLNAASISCESGKTKDEAGNNADLTLPNPGDAGSLGANKQILIDNLGPSTVFGTNGGSIYKKSHSTIVSATDNLTEVTALQYQWTQSQSFPGSGTWTDIANGAVVGTPSDANGDWYLHVKAFDALDNVGKATSKAFKLDNTAPDVAYTQNGSSTYSKSHSTTVNVTDTNSNIGTLRYQWSKDQTFPDSSAWTNFTNGAAITTPVNSNGNYYLHIEASDILGNVAKVSSNAFKLDNTPPQVNFDPIEELSYFTSRYSTVSVMDNFSGISSLQYQWSTGIAFPEGGTWKSFSSGDRVSTPLGATGEFYLHIKAMDSSGNERKASSGVFRTSNIPPSVVFGANGNPTYTKKCSTTVNIVSAHSTPYIQEYRWTQSPNFPSSGWTHNSNFSNGGTINTPSNANGDYYLHICAHDNSANKAQVTSNVFKLDNTAPQVAFGTNGNTAYNNKHSTTVTTTDALSGININQYQWTQSSSFPYDGTWTSFSSGDEISTPVKESGNFYLHIKAADRAGNETKVTSNVFKLDNIAPSVSISMDGNSNYAKSHTTSVVILDTTTAVNVKEYQWTQSAIFPTGGTWTAINGNITTPSGANGEYYLHIKAVDSAGNQAEVSSDVFKLDNVNPIVNFTPNGSESYIKSISTIVNVSDNLSGVLPESLQYVFDTGTEAPEQGWTVFTNGETISKSDADGECYLHIKASDNAGNVLYTCSSRFRADNTPPYGTISINGGKPLVNTTSVTLDLMAADEGIGNIQMRFSNDNKNWTDWEPFSYVKNWEIEPGDGEKTVYAGYIDELGNEAVVSDNIVLDTVLPTADVTYSTTEPTNQNITASLDPSESVTITNNGGSSVRVFSQNGAFTFEFEDAAGNKGTATATVANIDKNAPTALVSYSTTEPTRENVIVTIAPSEEVVVINNGGSDLYEFTDNGSFTFEFSDIAGNTGSVTAIVNNIDKESPVGSVSYSTTERTSQSVTATLALNEPGIVTNNGGVFSYEFTDNGSFVFDFADLAGNAGSVTASVYNIDKSLPAGLLEYSDLLPTNQDVTATLTVDENIEITNNEGLNTYTFSQNGSFTFELLDTVTQVNGAITAVVNNIDKVSPTAVVNYSTTSLTNQSVTAALVPSEPVTVTNNNGNMSYEFVENSSFTFEFADPAGNSGSVTASVYNIDKTSPEVSINYSTILPTNQSVTATLSANENITVLNNGGLKTYEFFDNGSFIFELADDAGNTATATASVENIDKTAPTATVAYSTTGLTNQDVTATITLSEEGIVTNNNNSLNYVFTQNGIFRFEYMDLAGNTGTLTAQVTNIDKTTPTATVNYSNLELTNQNVIVTMFPSESVTVTNNGGLKTFEFSENGSFTFEFIDKAGNKGSVTAVVNNIDKMPPAASLSYSATQPTNQNVMVEITLSKEGTITNNNGLRTYIFAENGEFTFEFADILGNTGSITAEVSNIDKTPPAATISYSTAELTNQNVTATIEPSEDIIVTNNNGSLSYEFSDNGTFTFEFEDYAGNRGNVVAEVNNIDKDPPAASVIYSTIGPTNQFVMATLVPSKEITVTNNDGATTYKFNENGTFTFEFKDLAGNTGSAAAVVNNIDKTTPTAIVTYSTTALTNGSVRAMLQADEQVKVTNNGGSRIFTFEENGEFTFEFVDLAGNTATATATVTNIDIDIPTAEVSFSTLEPTNENVIITIIPSKEVTILNNQGLSTYEFTENGQFTFHFIDHAGNMGSVTAEVSNIDREKPEITLIGGSFITVPVEGTYSEMGALAADNCDGDISGKITVNGSVDTKTTGIYTVRYNVSDTAGNQASEVERKVCVVESTGMLVLLNGRTSGFNNMDNKIDINVIGAYGSISVKWAQGIKSKAHFKRYGTAVDLEQLTIFLPDGDYTLYAQSQERETKVIHFTVGASGQK